MKIDIVRISEGEESISVRYREMTPPVSKIISILNGEKSKLWGRTDEGSICFDAEDILYLESVDDKVFAYTDKAVIKLDGTLNSFMEDAGGETFFRCSRSMIININKVVSLKGMSSNRIDACLEGGEHIIISRRYAVEFRKVLKGER